MKITLDKTRRARSITLCDISDALDSEKNDVPTTTNYTYNSDNELTQAAISGGATTTYSYDADGNQTGSTNGLSTTYNSQNQAVTVGSNSYSYSGTSQQDRVSINGDTEVYTGLGLSTIKMISGTTEFVRCSCGLLNNERTSNGSKYYYLFDGLGSIVEMTDSSGNAVNSYGYDPLGNINGRQEQAGINNPWRFAGGFYDSATGLLKYGIRYYDPTIGRWTQCAPIAGSLQETHKAQYTSLI